jgi:signal transduction histidine kinase/ligand-binding sensor domain-containing protein/CheY-like chemotaxis protein
MGLFSQGYLVHTYSEADGLPSANVYDITQDHQGRIWFATRAGITVYDGVSWKTYTSSDGLPAEAFSKLQLDREGKIWALVKSKLVLISVVYFDGTKWNSIKTHYLPDSLGEEAATTSFQLLGQQDDPGNPIIFVGTTKGIFAWNRGEWKHLTQDHGLLSNTVNAMASWRGKLYAATDRGLSIISRDFRIDNRLNRGLDWPFTGIKGIVVRAHDKFPDSRLKYPRVWLYGDKGIGYFDGNSLKMTLYPGKTFPKRGRHFIQMLPDYRGGLYVGNQLELAYFNPGMGSWESMGVSNGLIGEGANSTFIDSEKNIWIACERGVSKISSRRFTVFQQAHGLLEDEVSAAIEYKAGKFVLGHNIGITFFDGKKFRVVHFPRKDQSWRASTRVLDVQLDSQGNIWMANSDAGLARINPDPPHQITWYGEADGLHRYVSCLWIDRNQHDKMWVGTSGGIFLRTGQGDINRFVKMKTGQFPITRIRKIYGTPGKVLYVGSNSTGLYVYTAKKNQWENYRVANNSRGNYIFAIKKCSKGRLLIGTLAGLFVLENKTLKKFTISGLQVDRPVYFILEDQKNRLWFGTNNGVLRWDNQQVRAYSTAEGLMGQETNRAAAVEDSQGRIWIGTNRSVSIYDEQFDTTDAYNPPPTLRLLSLECSDRQIPLTANTPIRLSYEHNTMVFHFRGISFMDERAIRFKNKLEGFEKGWSGETYPYKQMIQYTNLPPGTYRFHLKARNMLGVWSDVVSSAKIIIMPPFYRTWWFFPLVILLIGGIFYGIFRFISQKRYAVLLEKQVEERTQQLEKAHQQLIQAQKMEAIGTLAGGIAHDFNNILGAVLGYTELVLDDVPRGTLVHKNAQHILNATQRAAELVKQILAFSRQSKQEQKPLILGDIVKEALKLFRSSLPTTIEIRQKIKAASGVISGDPTQIHQVMMNLCANAAHAMKDAGGILEVALDEVHLDADSLAGKNNLKPGDYLRLTVSDSGHGIPHAVMKRIFEPYFTTKKTGEGTGMGLAVIHGIVKNHNGDISVYSEPGQGTSFHLFFPKIEGKAEPENKQTEKVPGGKERILLVDDEKALTEMGTQMLERLGYEVEGISNPLNALEFFRLEPDRFQLIISDLTMPHMTGIQLAEEIKKIKPHIPVIICSGYSASLTGEQINALGIGDFIMKPVIKSELAQVVRKVLDRRQKTEDR